MAVQEQTPLREYTANGVTTSFALGFDCEETNHLIVTIDDVEVLPTDWYLSGSNVIFWNAPSNGKLIKLQRNTPFNRLADYQSYNNSFRPPAINKEFDRIWWKLQELGVADWILSNRISALKAYVDDRDDELRAYLLEEIRKQGVALDQLDDYYNYLMERLAQIAVDKGWDAAFVVDASGKTQQEINDSIAVKFLTAVDAGLVVWPEMKQPPYSQKDYDDAFNNGINFVRTLERLNHEGYNEIVFERFNGILPFCYSNLSGSTTIDPIKNSCHAILTGAAGLKVRGNNNQIHVMFDSMNRSPYDKATSLAPYQLRGVALGLEHNTDLEITGFELVGDQYTRSWVSGEQNTEQTYGLYMGINNINTKIDIVGRGFRGDAVSGKTRGIGVHTLDNNWLSGGVDITTGAEIVEAGSYRSPRIDLQGKTIYRNAVQIYTTGVLRAAEFRNDLLGVFFYDANGNFISTGKTRQCDFIYLPVNCRYIQFVAYEDERTDPVVGYGIYLFLATGSSDIAEVKGEYYANHRGAVSNLCGNTTVDAYIHDNGTTKYGFPHYGDVTRYGVNFEDTFVSKLTVRGIIQNGLQGVLCNARSLDVKAVIKDIQFTAVAAYGTFGSEVSGCELDNVGNIFTVHKTAARKKNRQHNINSNLVKNSSIYGNYSDNPDILISVRGNTFAHSSAELRGNGSNITFDDNTFTSLSGRYIPVVDIRGALSAKGNSIIRSNNVPNGSKGWGGFAIGGTNTGLNVIVFEQPLQRLLSPTVSGETPEMSGTELVLGSNAVNLVPVTPTGSFISHIDNREFKNCVFTGGRLSIGDGAVYASVCDSNTRITSGNFRNGFHIEVSRRATLGSTDTLLIKNVTIDLTNSTYLLRNIYALVGTLAVQFINCIFIADAPKSIAFIQGQTANITAKAIGCRFINVTNTDSILVVN
ncbi:hypothetical protein [Acinetobacter haemolyticus]|uniref:hypothetical protein n=1 Tax=Acinetobacter haemolyticus TaxID=29430 RepID=UPI001C0A10E0|nr:hypothetical protein [Acinetobacter haemolyticus]